MAAVTPAMNRATMRTGVIQWTFHSAISPALRSTSCCAASSFVLWYPKEWLEYNEVASVGGSELRTGS